MNDFANIIFFYKRYNKFIENMEKTEMLRQIAAHYHLERNIDFARFFGITAGTANQQRQQGILKYEDIYRLCPDISPDWLLSGGEGPMLRADRIENSGNLNFGDNVRQDINDSRAIKDALDSLRREQEALARSQEQVSCLITLLQSVSAQKG